jgi:hypothetical protein
MSSDAAGIITTTCTSDRERGTKVPSLTIILRSGKAFRRSVPALLEEFTKEAVRRMEVR